MSQNLLGKRIAVYARFSSELQRDASLEDQVRRCSVFVQQNAGTVDEALVFKDAALSGSSLHRPAFERMMDLVQRKRIDLIVTEDMSRISRDYLDDLRDKTLRDRWDAEGPLAEGEDPDDGGEACCSGCGAPFEMWMLHYCDV